MAPRGPPPDGGGQSAAARSACGKAPFRPLSTALTMSGSFLLWLGRFLLSSLLAALMIILFILLPLAILSWRLLTWLLSLPARLCLAASRAYSAYAARRLKSRPVLNDKIVVPIEGLLEYYEAVRKRKLNTNGTGRLTSSEARFGR
ncbi:hypothetical protein PG996_003788 [Apiospora saccharicola]|uniref:Uncharacterized protein n=1 Tax=Apiospora saccharicola TaxID=335842 RepID=A0ABR1W2C8_9PEZI